MKYPNLRQQKKVGSKKDELEWVYGEDATKLYAGKITNNVVQGTARVVMTDGMLRVSKKYQPVLTVHDEFGIICPDAEAKEARSFVHTCMTTTPKWIPGLLLESDVGHARRYGDAK